jgi:hypothetical protein
VTVYDSGGHVQEANPYDDSFIVVEPESGVSFQATINLQANLLFTQDELFPQLQQANMYPIYSIYRCGNLSDHIITKQFAPLMTGLKVRALILPGLLGVGIVLACLGGFFYYKYKQQQN